MPDLSQASSHNNRFRRQAQVQDILDALDDVAGLSFALADGDTATTNIPIAGIVTTDEIKFVLHNTAGAFADLTSEASITSDGNIQLSTTDTTGDQLLVVYLDKP